MVINLAILAVLLSAGGRPYTEPYHDTITGYFPPSLALQSFISNWTPADFGRPSSVYLGILLVYLAQILTSSSYQAETVVTFLPFMVSGIACYVFIRQKRIVQSEMLAITCALAFEFNWFTFELFASQLVIFAYSSIPLVLLYGGNLFEDRSRKRKDVVGLLFALLLGSLFWNVIVLPALLVFLVAALVGALGAGDSLRARFRRILLGVALSGCTVLLYALVTLPSSFLLLSQTVSGGVGAIVGHLFVVPAASPFTTLLPSLVSSLFLPLSPTLTISYWYLGLFFPLAFAVGVLTDTTHKRALALGTVVVLASLIGLMSSITSNNPYLESLVSTAYRDIFLLAIFNGPTVFFMVLVPLILVGAYIGVGVVEHRFHQTRTVVRVLGIALLVILVAAPISSQRLQILTMVNYGKGIQLDADNFNAPLTLMPKDIQSLVTSFNLERQRLGQFRVLWVPFDITTRGLVASSTGDVNTDISNQNLSKSYQSMLSSLTKNESGNAEAMAELGYKYIVVVTYGQSGPYGASKAPPHLLYSEAGVPLGLDGPPSAFYSLLSSNPNFLILNQTKDFAVFLNRADLTLSTSGVYSLVPGSCETARSIIGERQPDALNGAALQVTSGPPPYLNNKYELSVKPDGAACLLFATTYDTSWTASIVNPNGTETKLTHTEALGWENGYKLNGNTQLEIRLTYTHQWFQYALMAVSLASITLIAILYYKLEALTRILKPKLRRVKGGT